MAERAGLAALSLALGGGMLWLAWLLMRDRVIWGNCALAVLLFGAFVWLSPQVYYAYYRMIIEGLPRQWVIGAPPLTDLLRLVSFTGPATLSALTQGVLFWLLIAIALWRSKARGPTG